MRKRLLWLSLILSLLLLSSWLWRFWPAPEAACRVTFFDVGQGDAILIQTPDRQDILIDGGPSNRIVSLLGPQLGFGNRELELVILTHPDSDHLTGLIPVLERFPVRQIFVSDVENPTETFSAWQNAIRDHAVPVKKVSQGEQYELGNFLDFSILWPPAGDGWKVQGGGTPTNDGSVSLRAICAGSSLVMTGDASDVVEDRIVASGLPLQASLLKVGHHGSRTSSAHAFLQAVNPELAVISVGRTNRYGHPHPSVLERLNHLNVKVLRTDERGSITLRSNSSGGWSYALDKTTDL